MSLSRFKSLPPQSPRSGDLLLQMSVQSAATLLASDFRVASHVRSRFYRHARLTVTSTPEGEAKIEAHSLLGPVKVRRGAVLVKVVESTNGGVRLGFRKELQPPPPPSPLPFTSPPLPPSLPPSPLPSPDPHSACRASRWATSSPATSL